MKYTLIDCYKNTSLSLRDPKESARRILVSFSDGPRVEILDDELAEYELNFIDQDTDEIAYRTTIKNNMWSAAATKYYVRWRIEVKSNGAIVLNESLDLKSKKVKVVLDSESLGDLLAFIGPVNEFQKKHGCELSCVVFNKALFPIFKKSYPNINFLDINERDSDYAAVYKVGYFEQWETRLKNNPKTLSLSNIANQVLGLPLMEYKPNLAFDKAPVPKKNAKKYVCIGMQSTAQCKYWNSKLGWDNVVKYLKSCGDMTCGV